MRMLLLTLALACAACSSAPDVYTGVQDGGTDAHCQGISSHVPVSDSSCQAPPDAGPEPHVDYGETMYGNRGYDDDCKYVLSWTSTPVRQNTDVTFTVTAVKSVARTPATGAAIDPEVFIASENHPAPNSNTKTTESPPGTYTIGPIRFDRAGRWTVRFHLYHSCSDVLADSPHGHAAFYVDVP